MTRVAIMPDWMQDRLAGTVHVPGEVVLRPDEAPSFALFVSLGTQWRFHAATGQRIGLDYAAIAPTAAMMDMALTPRLFADLQAMEVAVLSQDAGAMR